MWERTGHKREQWTSSHLSICGGHHKHPLLRVSQKGRLWVAWCTGASGEGVLPAKDDDIMAVGRW